MNYSSSQVKRTLRVEPLEPRIVLDGNVSAVVVDGLLQINGDNQDNVFEVRQVFSGSPQGGSSFVVIPDASTSINNRRPGLEVKVNRIELGLAINSQGGNDTVAIRGLKGDAIQSLFVESGRGRDSVSVSDLQVTGKLCLSNQLGLDSLSVRSSSADEGVVIVSPTSGALIELRGVNSSFASIKTAFGQTTQSRTSLTVIDMNLDGRLDVVSTGATKLSFNSLHASGANVRLLTNSNGTGRSNVDFTDCDFDNKLRFSSVGNSTFSSSNLRCNSLTLNMREDSAGNANSSIHISDVDMDESDADLDEVMRLNAVGQTSVDLSRIQCDSIKVNLSKSSSGQASSSIRMSDMDVDGEMRLHCVNPASVEMVSLRCDTLKVAMRGDSSTTCHLSDIDIDGSMRVVSGAGADRLEFSSLSVGRTITVRTGQGVDTVSMSGLHVSKALDLRQSEIVSLGESEFTGPVRVFGNGGAVFVNDVSLSRIANKSTPIQMLNLRGSSSVEIDNVQVDGSVRVNTTGGNSSLRNVSISSKHIDKSSPNLLLNLSGSSSTKLESVSVEGAIRVNGNGQGNASLKDVSCTSGYIDKASPLLALNVSGNDQTTLESCVVEGQVRILGTESGKSSLKDVIVRSRPVDKSSPALMLNCVGGTQVVDSCEIDGAVRLHGSSGGTTLIKDVQVTSNYIDKSTPNILLNLVGSSNATLDSCMVQGPVRLIGADDGTATLSNISLGNPIDKSSPILMLRMARFPAVDCADGRVAGDIDISISQSRQISDAGQDESRPSEELDVTFDNFQVTGNFVVDSFFDVTYDLHTSDSKVVAPLAGIELRSCDVGGDFIVDSFFDVEYRVESNSSNGDARVFLQGADWNLDASSISVGGDFQVDSFFDISYQIGESGTSSSEVIVMEPSCELDVSSSSVGGDFNVDSFFDIDYRISSSSNGEPSHVRLDGSSCSVDASRFTVGGDFIVDSFFDVEYRLSGGNSSSSNIQVVEPSCNVDLRASSVGGDFNVDSFFDVEHQHSSSLANGKSVVDLSGSTFELRSNSSDVGGHFNVDSFFDVHYGLDASQSENGSQLKGGAQFSGVFVEKCSVGGDYSVDSFFDVDYQVETGATGGEGSDFGFICPSSMDLIQGLVVSGDLELKSSSNLRSENPIFTEQATLRHNVLADEATVNGDFTVDRALVVTGDSSCVSSSNFHGGGLVVSGDLSVSDRYDLSRATPPLHGTLYQSDVSLVQSSVTGRLDIQNSCVQSPRFKIEIDGCPVANVNIHQTQVGSFAISHRGASVGNLNLTTVRVEGDSSIQMGGQDDFASLAECVFGGSSLFDGGSEVKSDTIVLSKNEFATPLELVDWEVVRQ